MLTEEFNLLIGRNYPVALLIVPLFFLMPGQSKPFCLGRETENKFESVLDHFDFYIWAHDSYPVSRMIVTMVLMLSPQQSRHCGVSSPYAHLSKGYRLLSDPFQAKNKSYPEPPPCRHASQWFLQTLPLSAPTVGIVMRVWSLLSCKWQESVCFGPH